MEYKVNYTTIKSSDIMKILDDILENPIQERIERYFTTKSFILDTHLYLNSSWLWRFAMKYKYIKPIAEKFYKFEIRDHKGENGLIEKTELLKNNKVIFTLNSKLEI